MGQTHYDGSEITRLTDTVQRGGGGKRPKETPHTHSHKLRYLLTAITINEKDSSN